LNRTFANANAAGGILSSPRDMAKYITLHLNYGRVGDVQVIPEHVIGWVIKNSLPTDIQYSYGYGLAYTVQYSNGVHTVNHGGFNPPYNSQLTWLPGKGFGVFSSSSGPGPLFSGYNHGFIHSALVDMILANGKHRIPHVDNRPIDLI